MFVSLGFHLASPEKAKVVGVYTINPHFMWHDSLGVKHQYWYMGSIPIRVDCLLS